MNVLSIIKKLIVCLLLINNLLIFSQDTIQSFCLSRLAVERLIKQDKKCENLKRAYHRQSAYLEQITDENMSIIQQNDSIHRVLVNTHKELRKQNRKKRFRNTFLGMLIGVIIGIIIE